MASGVHTPGPGAWPRRVCEIIGLCTAGAGGWKPFRRFFVQAASRPASALDVQMLDAQVA